MASLLHYKCWISISIPPHKDSVLAGLMTTEQHYEQVLRKQEKKEVYENWKEGQDNCQTWRLL